MEEEKILLKKALTALYPNLQKLASLFLYKIKPFKMLHPPTTFHLLEIKLAINFCFYHERCIFNL